MTQSGARPARRCGLFAVAALGFVLVEATGWGAAGAPDPGGSKTVVLENERVRAQAIAYPPGVRGPEHEHASSRVVVVLEGGSLEIRGTGGETKTLLLKSGDVIWRGPEKHAIANVGSTTIRLVEIDVFDCPPR